MIAARGLARHAPFLALVFVLLAAPLVGLNWLITHPRANLEFLVPRDHFVIVTNVALLALAVAAIILRSALQLGHARALFLAMGFFTLAGLFAIHGLTTPGMIVHGLPDDYGGTATGVMAYLSMLGAATVFAARGFLPESWQRALLEHPRLVGLAIGAGVGLCGVVSITRPHLVGSIGVATPPFAYASALVTVLLLGYAIQNEMRTYVATRYPLSATLVVGFGWLAVAQICMALAPPWTLAWWEYHVLMLASVIIGLVGEFVELDRRRALERFLAPSVVDRVLSGTAASLGGERREITILFADLRESTALQERIEPEEAAQLLNDFFDAMATEIERFDGTLDKYLGDGLMALFGDRPPYEKHTLRAVRAAFAMQERMAQLQRRWQERGQESLTMGIGIADGTAMVGLSGSVTRMEYTAIGSPVNIASRLTSLARPGQILGTGSTYQQVKQYVEALPKAATAVKGLSQPIGVVELVALREPLAPEVARHPGLVTLMSRALADEDLRSSLLLNGSSDSDTAALGLERADRQLARDVLSLLQFPLFEGLPAAEIIDLAVHASSQDFDGGAVIIEAGGPPDALYLVVQGQVEVLIPGAEGILLNRGEVFGEIALFFDTDAARVRARRDTHVLVLQRDDCYALLRRAQQLRQRMQEVAASRMTAATPERLWIEVGQTN